MLKPCALLRKLRKLRVLCVSAVRAVRVCLRPICIWLCLCSAPFFVDADSFMFLLLVFMCCLSVCVVAFVNV